MPYIGKNPVSGGFHKLDALTASATATYALTLNSAAYYPETANQLLVSLNGVIQAPQDSFTVSGSNLIFDTALTASDSIDFVVALGDVLSVGSVTDGAITTAKLGNGSVTDAKIDTMAASKLTGALPAIDGSALTGIGGGTGSIVQVQYTMFTGTSTTAYTSSSNKKLTDLAVNITPTSTNSIIKLEAFVTGEFSNTNAVYNTGWFFYRDNTALVAPNAGSRTAGIQIGTNVSYFAADASSTPENANYMYFDSPSSTSQITYSVGFNSYYAGNWHLNRTNNDTNAVDFERGISSICVTEIAG